jgi:hypothetical protein
MDEKDIPDSLSDTAKRLKRLDKIKRDFVERNINSKNPQDRALAEDFKKSLDSDTTVMMETSPGAGKRIDKNTGKTYGPEMLKDTGTGLYEKKKPVKKAKGGMVSSASKRADGIAVKGKTRGKMV